MTYPAGRSPPRTGGDGGAMTRAQRARAAAIAPVTIAGLGFDSLQLREQSLGY
jgi:hypothetical protein